MKHIEKKCKKCGCEWMGLEGSIKEQCPRCVVHYGKRGYAETACGDFIHSDFPKLTMDKENVTCNLCIGSRKFKDKLLTEKIPKDFLCCLKQFEYKKDDDNFDGYWDEEYHIKQFVSCWKQWEKILKQKDMGLKDRLIDFLQNRGVSHYACSGIPTSHVETRWGPLAHFDRQDRIVVETDWFYKLLSTIFKGSNINCSPRYGKLTCPKIETCTGHKIVMALEVH